MILRKNNPDFLNSFLDYSITILNKSPNSIKEYNYDLSMFLKYISMRFELTDEKELKNVDISNFSVNTLNKITLDDIHAFVSYLAVDLRAKPATRARKISSIRIFFKYLTSKAHIISENPAQDLETPKLGKRMPKYLSLEESQKLLDITDNEDNRNHERNYAIITLFLNCGLRLSELVGINVPDIEFDECRMTVIGKGTKERTLYLNRDSMKAISEYLNNARPRENIKSDSRNALFLSERRERISRRTVQQIIEKELRVAGLDTKKYSVHKLRHTAATLM